MRHATPDFDTAEAERRESKPRQDGISSVVGLRCSPEPVQFRAFTCLQMHPILLAVIALARALDLLPCRGIHMVAGLRTQCRITPALHLSTGDQQPFPADWASACSTLPLNISWLVLLSAISVSFRSCGAGLLSSKKVEALWGRGPATL